VDAHADFIGIARLSAAYFQALHLLRGKGHMRCVRLASLILAVVCFVPQVTSGKGEEFHFGLNNSGEAVAEIVAADPAASWEIKGNEAAVAAVSVDGRYNQDVMIFGDGRPSAYRVLLGYMKAGPHTLRVERSARWSAPEARLNVTSARVHIVAPGSQEFLAVEHAPILYARSDTLGHFSDAPLLMWYETFKQPAGVTIQYSIVFSNEDGGTRTDALMARWGRSTDIEYLYRVTLDNQDRILKEVFLGIDEKPHAFRGHKERLHPLILDTTPNNDFTDTGYSPVQYRFMPVYADLSSHSREELMDRFPWTYRVMAEELNREHKLRPFGTVEGTKVSDPRNYLYLEVKAENHEAGPVAWIKLRNEDRWYSSNRGRLDLVITRSGWYRTTIELPPGTGAGSIQSLALECVGMPSLDLFGGGSVKTSGQSVLESFGKAFLLNSQYRPEKVSFEVHSPITLQPGEMYTFPISESKSSGNTRQTR
jgi:hypothetical protein